MMRRGFVILSVFIVVLLALLVVTGVLYLTQAETTARHRSASRAQSRSLGWSAAQVVMNELNTQRQTILAGERPQLDNQYELFQSATALGVVRLLPVAPNNALLQPESAKLDINEIDAETLAATNVVDSETAERIIEHRDRAFAGTFHSLADLASVPDLDPQLVFGPAARFQYMRLAQQSRADRPPQPANKPAETPSIALVDVLTVYAVEPAIQQNETQRINLNVPWSDELGERVDERFGEGAAQILRQLFERIDFNDDAKIIQTMIQFNTNTEDWIEILDVLTTEPGPYHFGRVNINTASRDVLATLPGIEPEQAAQIVQMRDNLNDDERASIVWPILHDVLPRQAYVELVDRITTRSWTYRLFLAVGTVDPDAPNDALQDPQIYEIVVDVSAPQPRIAYLRDVTLLQSAVMLASDATSRGLGIEQIESDDSDENLPAESDDTESTTDMDDPGLDPSPLSPAPANRPPSRNGTQPGGSTDVAPPSTRKRLGRWQTGD